MSTMSKIFFENIKWELTIFCWLSGLFCGSIFFCFDDTQHFFFVKQLRRSLYFSIEYPECNWKNSGLGVDSTPTWQCAAPGPQMQVHDFLHGTQASQAVLRTAPRATPRTQAAAAMLGQQPDGRVHSFLRCATSRRGVEARRCFLPSVGFHDSQARNSHGPMMHVKQTNPGLSKDII